ncbi:hypothetical protein CHARACLAT_012014 [Characodon lateralis]|uniref:Uncharacterized protein n=1 Tax=Characodon lateralis TaxID=208331 RepID=A0ABU7DQG4_9TELE|nr:hypothetical protein [Characodon lateralis]
MGRRRASCSEDDQLWKPCERLKGNVTPLLRKNQKSFPSSMDEQAGDVSPAARRVTGGLMPVSSCHWVRDHLTPFNISGVARRMFVLMGIQLGSKDLHLDYSRKMNSPGPHLPTSSPLERFSGPVELLASSSPTDDQPDNIISGPIWRLDPYPIPQKSMLFQTPGGVDRYGVARRTPASVVSETNTPA